ncbi:hypothetical protein GOZ81_04085 [Agrobacterium vitis]|uniref:hypothetical protein n=1 Tax=Agrobacterium vitis TaxID=373 RepID=UPI0012E80B0C|nr:hypothetical protein [Agrobacterium vitis]MVA70244.1 hypothetical protein [Agrobacterium vitis]
MEDKELESRVFHGDGAKELSDLQASISNLERVIKACALFIASNDPAIKTACFDSALINYRRAFNSGVHKGVKLSIFDSFHPSAKEFHELCIKMANKHIAHSVNAFEEIQVAILALNGAVHGVSTFSSRLMHWRDEGILQLQSLCNMILSVLRPEADSLSDRVLAAASMLSPEEIDLLKLSRYTAPGPEASGIKR